LIEIKKTLPRGKSFHSVFQKIPLNPRREKKAKLKNKLSEIVWNWLKLRRAISGNLNFWTSRQFEVI